MRERVKVNYGRTVNLGNYESLRIDVGIETDIKSTENIDDVIEKEIDHLQEIVEEMIGGKSK